MLVYPDDVQDVECIIGMGRVGNGISYYSPATKEQCDLLFSKMKEAGYEWDDENKELKKIEQKLAWSEEDEKMLNHTIDTVELHLNRLGSDLKGRSLIKKEINWLKSIKERVQPKQSIGRIFINKLF